MVPLMGGLTSGSTRRLGSFSFIVDWFLQIECFMLGAGYPQRYAAGLNVVQ